jgi:hypothetical protein
MHAVRNLGNATLFRTVGAAEDLSTAFNTVTDDPRAAMRTGGSERVDCTLEAVKHVRFAVVRCNGEGFVVGVSAVLTLFHAGMCSFQIVNTVWFHYNERRG